MNGAPWAQLYHAYNLYITELKLINAATEHSLGSVPNSRDVILFLTDGGPTDTPTELQLALQNLLVQRGQTSSRSI